METNDSIPLHGSDLVFHDSTVSRVLWIFSLVVVSITFFLGVLGNGLVIWVAGFRMPHTVTTICYLNLALADFSFTAILPFLLVKMAMKEKWPFGYFLCKLVHVVADINLFVSVFLIAVIALDRCICVLHPVWAQNHRTVSLARKVVVGPWILALILSLPPSLFSTTITVPGEDVYCLLNFESWANTYEELLTITNTFIRATGIIRFIIGFSMPMSIVAICYGLVAVKIHRRALVNSRRALRVLKAVVASFFICWFPSQLVGLFGTFWHEEMLLNDGYKTFNMFAYSTSSLAYFNSCLNPMLYVFMGQDFRERLIHSLPSILERALSEDSGQTCDTVTSSASPTADIEMKAI